MQVGAGLEHTSQLSPLAVSGYADNETMKRIGYNGGESLPRQVFEFKHPFEWMKYSLHEIIPFQQKDYCSIARQRAAACRFQVC